MEILKKWLEKELNKLKEEIDTGWTEARTPDQKAQDNGAVIAYEIVLEKIDELLKNGD